LLTRNRIGLGVPIESRVKSLESKKKFGEKQLDLSHTEALDDLVGVRLILLFRSD